MMDLQTIRQLSREAAQQAAEERKEPFVIQTEDVEAARAGDLSAIHIPTIGDYLPEGWRRIDLSDWQDDSEFDSHGIYLGDNNGYGAFFVDTSSCGGPGEPALTLNQFLEAIRPGYGYAVVEEGQFQVKVGVFERC